MTHWDKAIQAIQKASPQAKVYVGCDSVRTRMSKGVWQATYDTVVVLHHPRDGCNIFNKRDVIPDFGNIRMRMMSEVGFAAEAASAIVDHLQGRYMEIHLDINTDPQYKSSVAVKEAVGWIRGQLGITPKLKPEAWAATCVSDHFARGRNH
jgi:uncharacterized protein